MKLAKKIATMLLCICLVVPCLSMMVEAAKEGSLTLSSETAKAGEEVAVTLNAQVDAGVGKKSTITISYDKELLEFVSGTNTTKVSDGELQYMIEEEISALFGGKDLVNITFKVLKEGTATVSVKTYDIKSSSDISWTCHDGEVTISGGNAVTTTPSTDGEDDAADDAQDETTDDATEVSEGAEVVISSTTTITLISDVSDIILPEQYLETTVSMDGVEYPAWQDSENADMYILYASSTSGVKSLYQYDTLENTYQRFEAPVIEEETEEATGLAAIFGDNTKYVIIGAAAVLVILLILVIVLSVKLYNRNAELDEVYDDLDAALEEKEALKKAKSVVAPVVKEEQVQIETEDDVVLVADEVETEEDDSEVEVEFYVEESIKDFFAEETVEAPVKEEIQEEVKVEVKEEVPVKKAASEEYYDDDEEFYDDLDGDFSIDFIDLDD